MTEYKTANELKLLQELSQKNIYLVNETSLLNGGGKSKLGIHFQEINI